MVAWMFENGQMTPRQFAQKASVEGYEWAAIEIDDYHNASRWPLFKFECEQHGIVPGAWVTVGGNLYMTPADSAFAIAECEGPGDYDGIVNHINGVAAGPLPNCKLAICTNFNTPLTTPAAAAPLIDAGFWCLTEAYLNENPNADPDGLDQMARSLGWPTSQPVFGMYPVGGQQPPTYAQWQDWPGVDYLGEYVL
jgi:hypothetical protein